MANTAVFTVLPSAINTTEVPEAEVGLSVMMGAFRYPTMNF